MGFDLYKNAALSARASVGKGKTHPGCISKSHEFRQKQQKLKLLLVATFNIHNGVALNTLALIHYLIYYWIALGTNIRQSAHVYWIIE